MQRFKGKCQFLKVFITNLQICLQKGSQIIAYINGLLTFGSKAIVKPYQEARQRNFTDQANVLFVACCLPVYMLSFVYVVGLHWCNPKKTSLIGYWLLRDTAHRDNDWHASEVLDVFFNFWVWMVGIFGAKICFILVQTLCTLLFRDCMRTFWNMERYGMVPFVWRAVIYREVQVLGQLQTELQAVVLMGILILSPTLSLSVCSAMPIQLPWNAENCTVLLLSAYLVFICITAKNDCGIRPRWCMVGFKSHVRKAKAAPRAEMQ